MKLFVVQHSNDKCQNDLNVKLFDVGHQNVKCQNDLNVKHKLFDIRITNVKMI